MLIYRSCLFMLLVFLGSIVLLRTIGLFGSEISVIQHALGGDKSLHFFGSGLLCALSLLSLPRPLVRAHGGKLFYLFVIVIALEELSQTMVSNREFSLYDLAFSLSGTVLFGYPALFVLTKNSKQSATALKE